VVIRTQQHHVFDPEVRIFAVRNDVVVSEDRDPTDATAVARFLAEVQRDRSRKGLA
jgi:hypothetical protein